MNERLSDVSPGKVTPLDFARMVMRRPEVAQHEQTEPITDSSDHIAGDIIERDGKKYMLVPSLRAAERWENGKRYFEQVPYTYRQYYAHSSEEPRTSQILLGPGWDSKFCLYNPEDAVELHGRIFSSEELEDIPANLPDSDCLFVSDLEGGRVAEYLEYLENK